MRHTRIILGFVVAASALSSCSAKYEGGVAVIPAPNNMELSSATCDLKRFGSISYSGGLSSEACMLQADLDELGYHLDLGEGRGRALRLKFDETLGEEAYRMRVTGREIVIEGDAAGVYYGCRTLIQELRNQGFLRCGTIEDAPRYHWRGFMLDEARHFFGIEEVKDLLDVMADLKLNKFHWHLTDGQGWRIEIKAYPRLATAGGVGTHSNPSAPAQYYTQEQIREIVKYAAERHIEIIPEVDMPGHATAANRAYPEFCGGGSKQFPDFTFNVGKEGTYAYLTTILREVSDLFPSKYIHIGGDEVDYGSEAWLKDRHVQRMMKREGLKTIREAEGYFFRRMCDSLKVLGKTVIAWDDVLGFGPDRENSVICWWRHDRPQTLVKCLEASYNTILCPRKPMYYDFVQDASHKVGRIWDGFCPLEDVYAFPDGWYESWGLEENDMSTVMGIQSNLWTELVHNTARLDFMIYPRIYALAEAAWTESCNKDYAGFTGRMEKFYELMDGKGVYYFDARDASAHPEPEGPVIIPR